jgi:putative DNA primase/helicase
MIEANLIPLAMREQPAWVLWKRETRDGKATKVPYQAHGGGMAKSNDSGTWATFTEASACNNGHDGVGFQAGVEPGKNILIDLDHCLHDGKPEEWAREIVSIADSYTETSPSGDGLHIFCGGAIPGPSIKTEQAEIYGHRRFFTVTGKVFENRIQYRTLSEHEAKHVYDLVVATKPQAEQKTKTPAAIPPVTANTSADSEKQILEAMYRSRSGAAIRALMAGDTSAYGGDQSRADSALCSHLAFWFNRDASTIERVFRQSGLMREKWEKKHHADGSTYGQETVRRAVELCREVYSPGGKTASTESEPKANLMLSDSWNAEQLIKNFGDSIRYDCTRGTWLVWDGTRWKIDETSHIQNIARQSVRNCYDLAGAHSPDSEAYKHLVKWGLRSEQRRGLVDCIELAKALPNAAMIARDFDSDPLLFNVINGTVDLRTGELRKHSRDDFLTKLAGTKYDQNADCPQWREFLKTIFDGNQPLIDFVSRLIGLCLTAEVLEEILIFLYGLGANGKSTFVETMRRLFGDYFIRARASMLMIDKPGASIPNDIARLPGVRLAVCSELADNQRLNESLIKDLTGNDTISARFLHKEFFDFQPTHKLMLVGNHKPTIKGSDEGVWRRVLLIPFTVTISKDKRRPMPEIIARFAEEMPGILNWAITGFMAYKARGLQTPDEVKQATAGYRSDQDMVGIFLGESCDCIKTLSISCKDLYGAYRKWCEESGEFALKSRTFSDRMKERGFENEAGTGNLYHWRGISLKSGF